MNAKLNRKVYPMKLRIAVALACGLLSVGVSWAAGPAYWDWPQDRSFSELELSGTALDQEGYLTPGLGARVLGTTGPEVFWQAVPDGQGGFYTGSGHGGEVHHTLAGGQTELVAQLSTAEVFSLLLLPNGDLLAGCGPDGSLYRVGRDGQSRLVGSVAGGYVWAMAAEPGTDVVWLATGSPGGVYKYDLVADKLTMEAALPVENVMALHWRADESLLVATQGPGLLYRMKAGKTPQLLAETDQDEARDFIEGPDGHLFLLAVYQGAEGPTSLTGNSGGSASDASASLLAVLGTAEAPEIAPAVLYRIKGDEVVPWWTGKRKLMAATWNSRWGWLGSGDVARSDGSAVLWQLFPPSGTAPLARWTGGNVLDIMDPGADNGDLVVCQAQPGAVFGLTGGGDVAHEALSPALDGGQSVQWGRLRWTGDGNCDQLRWSVRAGNRQEPDESWSDWSKAWAGQDHELDLPPSRFLQWRVEFPAATGQTDTPRVTAVSVSAWQGNQPPVITSFQQEYLQDVHLGGMRNGMENVTQRFRSGLQAEFSRNATSEEWAGPARGALGRSVRVFTWQANDPDGDRVSYRLEYRRRGETTWRPLSSQRSGQYESTEPLASWDTSEVPDGAYYLRVMASDRLDNPAGLAAESQRVLGPLLVDNTAPEVEGFTVKITPEGFVIRGRVTDQSSVVAGARLRLPDGTWERLDPVDRICDSLQEKFAADIIWPRPGVTAGEQPWQVQLEVRDLGGNVTTVEGEAR